MENKIQEMQIQLETVSPNLKAIDRLKDVEERLKQNQEELENSKANARDAVSKFKHIKAQV